MNLSFSVCLAICVVLFGTVIFLYLYNPELFISRIQVRFEKVKFYLINYFTIQGKKNREKWRKLGKTIRSCEATITKYVNKKNLSTLKEDKTLKNMLSLYRKLLDIDLKNDSGFTLEEIEDIGHKVEDLYLSETVSNYNMEEVV